MTLQDKPSPLHRHLYNLEDFEKYYPDTQQEKLSLTKRCGDQMYCSRRRAWKTVTAILPITDVIKRYKWKKWIVKDLIAGISAGIMHIPQGMSYGYLAALQPVYGLYTSFFSVLFYVFFGTSKYLSFGVDAVTSILVGGIINMELEKLPIPTAFYGNFSGNGTVEIEDQFGVEYKASIASAASLTVGLILVGMGLLRLGFITLYLSDSFISGFTTGAAVHIATSQVPKMLGIKLPFTDGIGKIVKIYVALIQRITQTNIAELIISGICVIFLLLVKIFINERYASKIKVPLPVDLLVVILGTVASYFGNFHEKYKVVIVNEIPSGIPPPQLPGLDKITPATFIVECFIIAILVFAVSISMAKLCAKKHGGEVDDSQELVAYGMSNVLGSFFRCFPACCSSPRTMLLSTMGTKSTLNGLASAGLILLVLLVIGQLFKTLPVCVLAAMICVAMKNLFLQVRDLKLYWKVNIYDVVIWLATFLSVVVADIDIGLGIGVVVSAFTVLIQTQLAGGRVIGKSNSEDVAGCVNKDNIQSVAGIKVFKFETSFYFANAELLRRQLYKSTINPKVVLKQINKAKKKNKDNLSTQSISSNFKYRHQIDSLTSSVVQPKGLTYSVEKENTGYLDVGKVNGGYLDVEHVNEGYPDVGHMTLSSLEKNGPELGGNHIVFQRDKDRVRHVILDCSVVTYIDIAGIKMFKQIVDEYKAAEIEVLLAGCSSKMIRALDATQFFSELGKGMCFYEVTDAIQAAMVERSMATQSTVTKL